MSATKKAPRRKAATPAEPNHWEKVAAMVARDIDTCEQAGIDEAFTILKHAGPEAFQAPSVVVALRLVIEGTINVARDHEYFEPRLVALADLLGDHLHGFGLNSDCHGGWEMYVPSTPREQAATDTAFLTKLFPDKD